MLPNLTRPSFDESVVSEEVLKDSLNFFYLVKSNSTWLKPFLPWSLANYVKIPYDEHELESH